jgi:hypothetical protein
MGSVQVRESKHCVSVFIFAVKWNILIRIVSDERLCTEQRTGGGT